MKEISQDKIVRNHLEAGSTINPLIAYEKYGILRLGARIFNLRKEGLHITTRMKYKGRKRWAEYELSK